jgi:hypothetical protein
MKEAPTAFDLPDYYDKFEDALRGRYDGRTFTTGFRRIRERFREVRKGSPLTVDHVMDIFAADLPYVEDWTKPDRTDLARRMEDHQVAKAIAELGSKPYDKDLISRIRYALRELSLTALVLQHVYPNHYAMCSHHLAGLLYIHNASTVPEFYIEYCRELKLWGEKASSRKLNVEEAEFALWTWYRLANFGKEEEKKRHRKRFRMDAWVRDRRASRITNPLETNDRLELAASYLKIDPTLTAVIAWLEFELAVREILHDAKVDTYKMDMKTMLEYLPEEAIPGNPEELKELWRRYRNGRKIGRNQVMHDGQKLKQDEASSILTDVARFLIHNDWPKRQRPEASSPRAVAVR